MDNKHTRFFIVEAFIARWLPLMNWIRSHALLWPVLALALGLRILSPSPSNLVVADPAYLAAWSRHVAEATSIGLSREVIAAARSGDEQALAATLLRQPGNLTYAILCGLYENPEHVANLLHVLILGAWFQLVGSGATVAELFGVLVSLASVATIYILAWVLRRDRRIAMVSALLMALLPASVTTARWVSGHTFGQLTFTLSVLVAILALRRYGRDCTWLYLLVAGGVWGLSLYSNTLLPFLVPGALLPAFLNVARQPSGVNANAAKGVPDRFVRITKAVKASTIYLVGGAITFLPAMAFVGLRWSIFLDRNISHAAAYYAESTVPERLGAMLITWSDAVTLPILVLSLYGVWVTARERRGYSPVVVAWLAAYAAVGLVFGSRELFQNRAVMTSLPALVLMAAAGFVHLNDNIFQRYLAAPPWLTCAAGIVVLATALSVPTVMYLRSPDVRTSEWRAIEWVLQHAQPGAVVVTNLPNGVQVLAPDLQTYTVISAGSLLNHSQGGTSLPDYLGWRYPELRLPVTQLYLLLSLSQEPKPREQEILDAVSQAFLEDDRLQDWTAMAGFGPDIRIYISDRPN